MKERKKNNIMEFRFDPSEQLFTKGKELTDREKVALINSNICAKAVATTSYFERHPEIGVWDYFIHLANLFDDVFDEFPKDSGGEVKTVSLKAWLRKNDPAKIVDNDWHYGKLKIYDAWNSSNIYFKHKIDPDDSQKVFNYILTKCISYMKREEEIWFKEHDEYTTKTRRAIKLIEKFDRMPDALRYSISNENHVVLYDATENKRNATLEELDTIIDYYEKLDGIVIDYFKKFPIKY